MRGICESKNKSKYLSDACLFDGVKLSFGTRYVKMYLCENVNDRLQDRDLILRDDALIYIVYMMLIRAPLIPVTRWSCSQTPADSNDC